MGLSQYAAWIEWTRTPVTEPEVRALSAPLSPAERAQLEDLAWTWTPGQVLWRDPGGALRRARFTHVTFFETAKGAFYVDSRGRVVRRNSHSRPAAPRRRPGSSR